MGLESRNVAHNLQPPYKVKPFDSLLRVNIRSIALTMNATQSDIFLRNKNKKISS